LTPSLSRVTSSSAMNSYSGSGVVRTGGDPISGRENWIGSSPTRTNGSVRERAKELYPDLARIVAELKKKKMFGGMGHKLPKLGIEKGTWDVWSTSSPLGWGRYKQKKGYRRHSGIASVHGTDRPEYSSSDD